MKKGLYILLLLLLTHFAYSQNEISQWRARGWEAKQEGNTEESIKWYSRVLQADSGDYDAKLALARLYYSKEDYAKSIEFFNEIYANDETDVEALKGLGDNYLFLDSIPEAINYYQKALYYLPGHFPTLFQLAKAYSWQGDLDKAIATYKKILAYDNTYAEAYQGIGKMYYWKDQPNTAMSFYEQALALDSQDVSIRREYQNVKNQANLSIENRTKYVQEKEITYQIDAIIDQIILHKRFFDHLDVSLNILADHSNRDYTYTDSGDTLRWYNANWAKVGWITNRHKIYGYFGYSFTDKRFSTYGVNWQWNLPLKNVDISNSLTGGYDYFYYWNTVGKMEVNDNIKLQYKKWLFNVGGSFGLVDRAFILDVPNNRYEDDENPFHSFTASLSYQILGTPGINIAANYSLLDYTYKSTQYYSPKGRNLFGPSVNIYHAMGNFYVYADFSYNFGSEYYYEQINTDLVKSYLDANNWSANAEFGYTLKSFSASLSGGRFYNNYYQNLVVSLNLKYTF